MTKRYRIFDTITMEVIAETARYSEARSLQKTFNTSPCAMHHGTGYVVRFALQDAKYPRTNGLQEPALKENA